MTAFVAPRLEMVAHRCAFHAVLFGRHCQFNQLPGRKLLR
jgi:hypothetical protein